MALSLLTLLLATGRASADEVAPAPLHLVRPDSLTGWDHGASFPTGWTVDGQRLRGCSESTPLESAWILGDFTLDFTWRVIDEGLLEVLLRTSFPSSLLVVRLGERASAGRLLDNGEELAHGRELIHREQHTCRIERRGESLRVTIDGEPASEGRVAGERRFDLSLNVSRGVIVIEDLTIAEPRGEAIFNGVDLTGWETHRKADVWAVDGGELITTKNGGEYLRSVKEYGNFTLAFDYFVERGGNSGLGIRTPKTGWPSGDGMELQIYDRPGKEAGSQMSIYQHLPPLERPDVSEAWNQVVVKCDGPIVTAWINGQLAQHADLDQHPELAKKPRSGWLGFQNHGSATRVRNVHLFEAPP
jgi:hypothetical protein